MPVIIDGSGTISGVTVGGLPDGIVDSDMLASGVGGKVIQYKQYQAVGSYSSTSTSWSSISSDFEFDFDFVLNICRELAASSKYFATKTWRSRHFSDFPL